MSRQWSCTYKIIAAGLLTALVFFIAPSSAHADCTAPAATAGTIINNGDDKIMQYCDGTNWAAMHRPGSGSGGCSGWPSNKICCGKNSRRLRETCAKRRSGRKKSCRGLPLTR